ncbi:hypothetical protein B0H63DRAFT_499310 [Podospora didyma]|uniref:Uncharacterized protein n=1 Tax=Podospora didyma TaxID=330526 RepID=A0AAE0P8C1_9PEZI|nr:hypothetical protein B0H63DRAFT_499310 [Podospora didyma]
MEPHLLKYIVDKKGIVIDHDARTAITTNLWPPPPRAGIRDNELKLDSYFRYYAEQCQGFLSHHGRFITVRTHQDIVDVTRLKESNGACLNVTAEMISRTTDLTARLFLMMSVGGLPHGIDSGTSLRWNQGTIRQFVQQHFDVPPILSHEGVKLPKLFNAHSLVRMAGIKIEWTTNLADHLRMIDDDQKVSIFCHPSFLMLHKTSEIFPEGFVEETLQTLKLLFPSDKSLEKWVQSLPPTVDKKIASLGTPGAEMRHIEKFRFWRDRLMIVKQVFDEAEPSSLSQWWYNRSRRVQWYTWWLGVLVLLLGSIFGLIQCTLNTVQVYKLFNP